MEGFLRFLSKCTCALKGTGFSVATPGLQKAIWTRLGRQTRESFVQHEILGSSKEKKFQVPKCAAYRPWAWPRDFSVTHHKAGQVPVLIKIVRFG